MNVFQWITVPLLGLLFLIDLRRVVQRSGFRMDRVLRCLTWLAAAVAIYNPQLTADVARAVGIETGTHLVLYVFVLVFLAVAFHLYARTVRLERQMTDLVRHIAVTEARPPLAPSARQDSPQREPEAVSTPY